MVALSISFMLFAGLTVESDDHPPLLVFDLVAIDDVAIPGLIIKSLFQSLGSAILLGVAATGSPGVITTLGSFRYT